MLRCQHIYFTIILKVKISKNRIRHHQIGHCKLCINTLSFITLDFCFRNLENAKHLNSKVGFIQPTVNGRNSDVTGASLFTFQNVRNSSSSFLNFGPSINKNLTYLSNFKGTVFVRIALTSHFFQ